MSIIIAIALVVTTIAVVILAMQLNVWINKYNQLRSRNIDLVNDNLAKANALRSLTGSVRGFLVYDIEHTIDAIETLLEEDFFEGYTLFDVDAVDRHVDWFTLERLVENMEKAEKEMNT
jgi:hypothetical protein